MQDWNVVVTVYEGGYNQAKRFLEQFGPITRTDFFNLLVMRTVDHRQFLEDFHIKAGQNLEDASSVARVLPVVETFTFQKPEEFDAKAQRAVTTWLPLLANKTFHLRMHRRGFKGKISSMDEERFLDEYLLQALEMAGTPGHITFENPDVIIALETIGPRAGLSAWTRDELKRFPFLHLD